MPEVILPCPTNGCAGIGKIYHSPDQIYVTMLCVTCGLSTGYVINPEEAIARWNKLPRALRWTHEPPKVAGWYWRKETVADRAHVFHFTGNWEDYGEHWESDRVCQLPLILNGNLWAGPIPAPID